MQSLRRRFPAGLLLAVLLFSPALAAPWAIRADIAESCSCDVACPCIFGSPATHEHCEGSRLVEIREGHFGNVRLDGVRVLMTFRMGAWVKYYIHEEATAEQAKATENLLAAAFPDTAAWGVQSVERVAVPVERTEDRLKFSGPASHVEIEPVRGEAGEPVRIENLGFPGGEDYTQYRSIRNDHRGEEVSFRYSGTNGFTSTIDLQGED